MIFNRHKWNCKKNVTDISPLCICFSYLSEKSPVGAHESDRSFQVPSQIYHKSIKPSFIPQMIRSILDDLRSNLGWMWFNVNKLMEQIKIFSIINSPYLSLYFEIITLNYVALYKCKNRLKKTIWDSNLYKSVITLQQPHEWLFRRPADSMNCLSTNW